MKSIVAFLIVAYLFTFAKVGAQTNNAYFQPGKYRSEMRDTAVMCLNKAEEILDNSPQEAYDLANKARSIAISLNEKEAEATANRIAGIANVSLDKAKEAELLLTDALTSYRKNNNEKYIADIYYYLGKAYFSMAEYESSVEFYQHAIKVYQKLNSIQDIAYAFQNLGLIHQNLDNFEKAVDYYNRAMDINLELDNQEQIAALLQNIGTIESMKNNPGKARDLYLQSLEIFHTINDTQGIATTYSNIGLLKLKNQELKEANAFFDTAYAYFSQINLRLGQVWTLFNLGVCEYYKENYDKAEQYYFQSLNLSKEIDNKEGKLSNYEALSNLYQKTKKFEVALDYYKDYIAVGDSIHSTETQQKIAEFEAMNNYEASQRLLAKVDNELKRKKTQNKALYGVFSVVLLASVVVFFAYR
ncbi:MAG: tetratricopeptide repeat protein, partial [Bacteroidales bacterium]|nr:tetratricopeptide repeat protein [Bacteroidales bacterium]